MTNELFNKRYIRNLDVLSENEDALNFPKLILCQKTWQSREYAIVENQSH